MTDWIQPIGLSKLATGEGLCLKRFSTPVSRPSGFCAYPLELEARAGLARQYAAQLENNKDVQLPVEPQGVSSAWALYTVRLPNTQYREAVQTRLKEYDIPSMVHYAKPLHLQPAFASLGYKSGDFPVAEDCEERVLGLPLHPYLRKEEAEFICSKMNNQWNYSANPNTSGLDTRLRGYD